MPALQGKVISTSCAAFADAVALVKEAANPPSSDESIDVC